MSIADLLTKACLWECHKNRECLPPCFPKPCSSFKRLYVGGKGQQRPKSVISDNLNWDLRIWASCEPLTCRLGACRVRPWIWNLAKHSLESRQFVGIKCQATDLRFGEALICIGAYTLGSYSLESQTWDSAKQSLAWKHTVWWRPTVSSHGSGIWRSSCTLAWESTV